MFNTIEITDASLIDHNFTTLGQYERIYEYLPKKKICVKELQKVKNIKNKKYK